MLAGLEWKLNPATPQAFLYQFLSLLKKDGHRDSVLQIICEVANYIIDVALLANSELKSARASSLALASVWIALNGVQATVLAKTEIESFQEKIDALGLWKEEIQFATEEIGLVFHNQNASSCSSSICVGDLSFASLNEVRRSLDGQAIVYNDRHR